MSTLIKGLGMPLNPHPGARRTIADITREAWAAAAKEREAFAKGAAADVGDGKPTGNIKFIPGGY